MSIRNRFGRIGLSTVAAAATALGLSAGAMAGAFTGSGITFSTQAVNASGGAVTIGVASAGFFSGVPVTFTAAAGEASPNGIPYTFTVVLPSGTSFTTVPSATGIGCFGVAGTGAATTLTVALGGIGANFVTYNGTTGGPGAPCSTTATASNIQLSSFSIAGATALQTPNTTTFKVGGSLACNSGSGCLMTELSATPAQLASSASSIVFDTGNSIFSGGTPFPASAAEVIDITAAGGFGTKFLEGGVDSLAGDDGAIGINIVINANATDTAAFVPGSTANITVTAGGGWGGIATVYLTAGTAAQQGTATTNACSTAVPGTATTGVLSGNTETFFGVTLPGVGGTFFYELCKVSGASTLIAANPVSPVVGIASPAGSAVGFVAGGVTMAFPPGAAAQLNVYNYNGLVQNILYSFIDPFYRAFYQIVNYTNAPVTVFARAQSDTGSVGTGTINSASSPLAANSSELIPASTVVSATGISLGSTGRFSVTFFIPSPVAPCAVGANGAGAAICPVAVNQQVLSPNGTLINGGSGTAP